MLVDWIYGLLFLRSMVINLSIFKSIRYLKSAPRISLDLDDDVNLVLLLKVYRETVLIEETVEFIKRMIDGHKNLSVIIVGNAKERDEKGKNPTLEVAKRAVNKDYRFKVLECDHPNATHAHQNNHALANIDTPGEKT